MKTFTDHKLRRQDPGDRRRPRRMPRRTSTSRLAVTNPTPLSIPFIIEDFVPEVAKAVDGS